MIKRLILLSLLPVFGLTSVQAQQGFSKEQRSEINQMIRAYILENPEIIPEAIEVLQQRAEDQRLAMVGEGLFDGPGAVVVGNPEGSATIVEFFDYRCPYCKRGWSNIKKLIKEDKDLRVVFRQFPVKDQPGETISRDAALMAMAAHRQGKYLEFHDAVFTNPTVLNQDRLDVIAKSVGLDKKQLEDDMEELRITGALQQNMAIARTLGLTGTPSYIVGNTIVRGLAPHDQIKALLQRQRLASNEKAQISGGGN